ncbi:uncharacterized protein LOC112891762 isoform X3 [Panicum hallii]|uniref:uncharacterized protein LOC112891762 isoform X3 n=1 Tax=Panicum hallii TaxID=206008 RepID=UPI000DF4E3B7|nr:uncharacterized protein LOC112891762 isoform X3 [Panicum hallii]
MFTHLCRPGESSEKLMFSLAQCEFYMGRRLLTTRISEPPGFSPSFDFEHTDCFGIIYRPAILCQQGMLLLNQVFQQMKTSFFFSRNLRWDPRIVNHLDALLRPVLKFTIRAILEVASSEGSPKLCSFFSSSFSATFFRTVVTPIECM